MFRATTTPNESNGADAGITRDRGEIDTKRPAAGAGAAEDSDGSAATGADAFSAEHAGAAAGTGGSEVSADDGSNK